MDRNAFIETIITALLGKAVALRDRKPVRTIGPFKPELSEEMAQALQQVTADFRAQLQGLADQELTDSFGYDGEVIERCAHPVGLALQAKAGIVRSRHAIWYLGGLGHPDYAADFAYWSKIPHLTLAEAVCLSLGVEPSVFSEEDLERYRPPQHRQHHPDHVGHFIGRRFELLRRQFQALPTGQKTLPMAEFKRWVVEHDIEVTDDFRATILGGHQSSSAEPAAKANVREMRSVAKLLYLIAVEHYGYEYKRNNSAARKLKHLADQRGISLSDDTILKYLKIGSMFPSKG